MIQLARTVRFCLNGPNAQAPHQRHNGYSAFPPVRGLGRYYELRVQCAGEPDPATGYMINIKHIDSAVRDHVLPYLDQVVTGQHATAEVPMGTLLREMAARLDGPLRSCVTQVRLQLSPFHSLILETPDMDSLLLRQQYEFAAAHRLHVPQLSDEENRRVFGKCNNPSGHGHNYRVEVAVRLPIDPAGRVLPVEQIDALVDEAAIQKLDHKHLNIDVPQFAKLNPSVENITKVVYDMLEPRVAEAGGKLEEVSVWETEKTVCTYRR